jgi:hypothetical protein
MSSLASNVLTLFDRVVQHQCPSVVQRIQEEMKITMEEAQEVFDDTKKFLFLCGSYQETFAPTPRIDEGWHAFILHTRDYAIFCKTYFGKFIHHVPTPPINRVAGRNKILVNNTRMRAERIFGKLSMNWEIAEGALCEDFKCKGCDNWE